MKHKLIIVDGQSTCGKSTISKSVSEQISSQDDVYWLHEECYQHPIRHEEFRAGNIHTQEGMELNMQLMLEKWKIFCNDIIYREMICITEGCFLHSIDRYLIDSIWNDKQIKSYFDQIMNILKPLNPLIVFLKREDLEKSFKRAFIDRGNWWKDLILSPPEPFGYFETHEYTGDDSIYDSIRFSQEKMEETFDGLSCTKLKIDTSNDQWDTYVQQITLYAGYEYFKIEKTAAETEKYCGTYEMKKSKAIWKIGYDIIEKQFFTSLFWPYMKMKYIGDDCFLLDSFPVKLKFGFENGVTSFTVEGNYDWEYNEEKFIKSVDKSS